MTLIPFHDPEVSGQLRIAGMMSGSGSNLRKIIELEHSFDYASFDYTDTECPYKLVVIFSDNPNSKANEIGEEFDIPVIIHDMKAFYNKCGKPRKDMEVRKEYDSETVNILKPFDVDVIAYGGYMSIVTQPLIDNFLGVNVHPADLSIKKEDGKRKYTGDHAVRDAILAGERYIRSTTHIVEQEVDGGRIIMISSPLEVELGADFDAANNELVKKVSEQNQNRLKEAGDWVIFPKTLLYIAQGRFAQDGNNNLYFDEKPIPNGHKLD